jgi:hypothetical protein
MKRTLALAEEASPRASLSERVGGASPRASLSGSARLSAADPAAESEAGVEAEPGTERGSEGGEGVAAASGAAVAERHAEAEEAEEAEDEGEDDDDEGEGEEEGGAEVAEGLDGAALALPAPGTDPSDRPVFHTNAELVRPYGVIPGVLHISDRTLRFVGGGGEAEVHRDDTEMTPR